MLIWRKNVHFFVKIVIAVLSNWFHVKFVKICQTTFFEVVFKENFVKLHNVICNLCSWFHVKFVKLRNFTQARTLRALSTFGISFKNKKYWISKLSKLDSYQMVNKNTAICFVKKPNCVHAYFYRYFFTNWLTRLISVKWKPSSFTRDTFNETGFF